MTTANKLIDPAEIRRALVAFLICGQVTEVRILEGTTAGDPKTRTLFGFFNDPEKLIEALENVRTAKGFYFTPNPVNPALLSRSPNLLKPAVKGQSTGDLDIFKRRWLLIDCDPVRPTDSSSTDAEHQLALSRVEDIRNFLAKWPCPEPIVADSGNGAHLLYRIDLPTVDQGIVAGILNRLAREFDDERVHVDTKVFNPARIWKLYGTRACKGQNLPERPHRMARIILLPGEVEVRS